MHFSGWPFLILGIFVLTLSGYAEQTSALLNSSFYNGICSASREQRVEDVYCLAHPKIGHPQQLSFLEEWFMHLGNATLGAALPPEWEHLQCAAEPLHYPPDAPIKRYVVYDWGSSSVRFLVLDIDFSIEEPKVYEYFRSVIALPPNYTQADLPGRIAAWVAIRWGLEAFFPADTLHHRAIATAGLRLTQAGQLLQTAVSALGIPVKILSQEEEGQLALKGLGYTKPELSIEEILAWDIGGKSMQWIAFHPIKQFNVLGSDGGLFHLLEFWQLHEKNADLPEWEKIDQVFVLMRQFFLEGNPLHARKGFDLHEQDLLKNLATERQVYGIGFIHSRYAHYFIQKVLDLDLPYYNAPQLYSLIQILWDLTEQEVLAFKGPEVLSTSKMELLLIFSYLYQALESLAIDRVYPVNIDNREGLLAEILLEQAQLNAWGH